MSFRYSFLHPARDAFFKEKQAENAFKLLEPYLSQTDLGIEETRAVYQLAGLIRMSQYRYAEAKNYFNEVKDNYLSGYCELLQGNFQQIQSYWGPLLQYRVNHWCVSLFGLVTMQLNTYPTMFQVRNHLESDLSNLIKAGQDQMVENVLSYADFLTQVNLETPKFMGRALLNNLDIDDQWLEKSGQLLLMAQKTLPNDPEVYYHLGQYRVMKGETEDACRVLKQCIMMSPAYTPAEKLLKEIEAA